MALPSLFLSPSVSTLRQWVTYKINRQSLMAWQHKDAGITPTNANSAPSKDPIRIDYQSLYNSIKIKTKRN